MKKRNKRANKAFPAKTKSGVGIFPLADRALIKPLTPEETGSKSPAGIIIPETVDKEKPEQGRVIAVGEGKLEDGKRVPMSVKAGDRVMFSKYGYDEIKVGGAEYYIISESNILAIIK
jgi:chaperonin GroES